MSDKYHLIKLVELGLNTRSLKDNNKNNTNKNNLQQYYTLRCQRSSWIVGSI